MYKKQEFFDFFFFPDLTDGETEATFKGYIKQQKTKWMW